jgi:hypothetical protein
MDTRGEYRFSSLVKQKIKEKICFVIHIAGEKKLLFYFCFVIVKQKIKNGALITTGTTLRAFHQSPGKVLAIQMLNCQAVPQAW